MTAIDRSDLLMTLEDGYIDNFEDMSWLYTLPELFYSWQQVITHPEYLDLPEKLNWLYLLSIW